MTNQAKKILLIAATHGDETMSARIIKKLKEGSLKEEFDDIIGNPEAAKQGKRYIDIDLNRVYPGSKKSLFFETRQAAKNLFLAKQYRYVLDIHEIINGRDVFVILPQEYDEKNRREILKYIAIDKIVFWPSVSGRKTGPISQFLENCIEIEIGSKALRNKKADGLGARIVSDFIKNINNQKEHKTEKKKQVFQVRGRLLGDKNLLEKLRKRKAVDFKKITMNGSVFYPLLIGQYIEDGIVCYKMDLLE